LAVDFFSGSSLLLISKFNGKYGEQMKILPYNFIVSLILAFRGTDEKVMNDSTKNVAVVCMGLSGLEF
jgi:hypothetical protein